MSAQRAIAADRVFDGSVVHRDAAVLMDGVKVMAVMPRGELPAGTQVRAFDGAWLAPGFIDLQVNGGGDVLFNDEPTPQGIAKIAAAHRRFGTTGLLPTLISDTRQRMQAALGAVAASIGREPGLLGIHLEGPFLSPEKPGVHDPAMIRTPTRQDMALLMGSRDGVTLMTLAPECLPTGTVTELVRAGLRVSLGHSNATYAETQAAMAEGLTGFTHLFNAMRPMASRDPGPIVAALESANAWFGMIVDGVHVDPAMLRLALRGRAHPILVTDAMPPVGGRRSSFKLYGEEMTVRDGRCTRRDGTLAGACLDMASAVRNAVRLLDVALPVALRMASANPAEFIGRGHMLGKLAPGYRADFVAFEPQEINVIETWVAGASSAEAKAAAAAKS